MVHFGENTPFSIEFLGKFEMQRDCDKDFVEIRNGEDVDAPLILKGCGNTKPDATTLLGSSVKITFKSGLTSWHGASGFSVKISKLSESDCE